MPIWFNWSPLAPLLETYEDDGSRDLCTAEISIGNAGEFRVSLVGSADGIDLIRVATLNSDGNLTPKQSETVSKLVDHMISVLKLTHDAEIDLIRFGENTVSIGAHDIDGRPKLRVNIDEIRRNPPVAADNIRNVLLASMGARHLMRLLADAQTPALPLQYRYLSLYKVLELEFRVAGLWSGLNDVLNPYEDEFKALNISRRLLRNVVHQMRDRCAHIKVGGNDKLGIVGLDDEDIKIVQALMSLVRKAIIGHLSNRYPGLAFQHQPAV